ncbi:MAG: DUF3179 domain-containing protein, partial [Acidobacteria bacterium]|nr:DUF3179 domain-containing protein [Acidobacteriota bacterium]
MDHSGVVYDRTIDGRKFEFGAVGVQNGTLIMYDQQTKSWWSQLFGKAVDGPMKEKKLVKLPSTMTTWKKWKALHPDTTVYVKRGIPYDTFFTESQFAAQAKKGEGPIEGSDLVLGVEGHVSAKAYLIRYLAAKGRVRNDFLEGQPIVVFLSEDLATARIFDRSLDGWLWDKTLTFRGTEGD